jgi:glutathionylspermidine synthase
MMKTNCGSDLDCQMEKWACTPALPPEQFAPIRNQMILDGCKWDPQVGDVSTLAPFAIVLPGEVWKQLAHLAEELTEEAIDAERELLDRPELFPRLGQPELVAEALSRNEAPTRDAGRVFRFDFHPTSEGWRISEANSDVPGGYTEASIFHRLMAEQFEDLLPAGNPAERLAEGIIDNLGYAGRIALLAATGYMEDQQVTAYLESLLRSRGCETYRAHPRQVRWKNGTAHLRCQSHSGPVDAVIRFFQGEWLTRLPARCGWTHFFRGGHTPVLHPGSALLIESKRFPLVWDRLETKLPTWKRLLPETRHPRQVRWRRDSNWLLKTSFCNTGDTVTIRTLVDRRSWFSAAFDVLLRPGDWIAQRRFEASPLPTPQRPMFPCLGVYTVNSRAAGIYGRISSRPVIDYSAIEVAVLIRKESSEGCENGQARAL